MTSIEPLSAFPALLAILLAFATAHLLSMRAGAVTAPGRYASIDGLRGYLAFFVFLHHASIWYFYQRGGVWEVPPSHLFTHFGQSSVALFFMITAFLFFSKLLDGRKRPIDWLKLLVSRVLRLVPLYWAAMLVLFVVIAALSDFALRDPLAKVIKQAIYWLGFTMLWAPPINQVAHTGLIVAGVVWSLPYEWFFYGALPLLALTAGAPPRWPYLLLGIATLAWLISWGPLAIHLWSFAGGIAAALAVRSGRLRTFATSRLSTMIVLAALAAVLGFSTSRGYPQIFLLSLAFVLIACGNSLFGLLLQPASRVLGDMAYSIYLLHGIVLFLLFHFVLAVDRPGAALGAAQHWGWVLGLTPCLVLLCQASFQFIERPAMQQSGRMTAWLRRPVMRLNRRDQGSQQRLAE